MYTIKEYLNTIIQGDTLQVLKELPSESVDLIFADPPYNLQLKNNLYRPNQTKVEGVSDSWDKFNSFTEYDEFTQEWLLACKRVLKKNGTVWVIGTYHNIYRLGYIMQNIGYWFLNDIIWNKPNPMPNFKGTRFTNAHETLLWASKDAKAKYTFHYKAMKTFNGDIQMRSDWHIPICNGTERIKVNGKKAHSTQKPEELLMRILLATSNAGDIILDPFMGSGTTGAVAKKLGRCFIGIEKEQFYIDIARERINKIVPIKEELLGYEIEKKPPRVPFGSLIEKGLIKIGEYIFNSEGNHKAKVLANASIQTQDGLVASIHKASAVILNKINNNGWNFWHVQRNNTYICIDNLRTKYINMFLNTDHTRKEK